MDDQRTERKGRRPIGGRFVTGLRLLALMPFVWLPLLLLFQVIADQTYLPVGVVCFLGWMAVVVLWFIAELFTTKRFRFSLARLLLAVTCFAAFLSYCRVHIIAPYMQERE